MPERKVQKKLVSAMKGNEYTSNDVLCPFYACEVPQEVKCEGVETGTALHVAFDTRDHKNTYKMQLCCDKYNRCMIYKMLEAKYE